jgi:hypothetical protein
MLGFNAVYLMNGRTSIQEVVGSKMDETVKKNRLSTHTARKENRGVLPVYIKKISRKKQNVTVF